MKTFEFLIRHNNGKLKLHVRAESLKDAEKVALDHELCPKTAILWWRVVPTAKQIQKTKNLLRGI